MSSHAHLELTSIIVDNSVISAIANAPSKEIEEAAAFLAYRLYDGHTKGYVSAYSYFSFLSDFPDDKKIVALEATLNDQLNLITRPVLKDHGLRAREFKLKNKVDDSLAFNMVIAAEQGVPLVVAYDAETVNQWVYLDGVQIVTLINSGDSSQEE